MDLFHYTRWELKEEHIGRVFCISWQESHYWKQKLHRDWAEDSLDVPELYIGATSISALLKHGKYAAEVLKEFVFEEVRQRYFGILPSRRRCLFAFPSQLDPSAFRDALGFSNHDRSLIRIQPVDGARIHFARMDLLDCNLSDYEELTRIAQQYWSGCEPDRPGCEALLEGSFRIMEILRRDGRKFQGRNT